MGMDATITINGESYDAYKGRYVYYYLRSDWTNPMEDKMTISYNAEGGYGKTECLIKIGKTNGNTQEIRIYSYDHVKDRYKGKYIIPRMSDVLIVRVAVFSPGYGYEEKFNKKFQKQLNLYKLDRVENFQNDNISNETETKKITIKFGESIFYNCDVVNDWSDDEISIVNKAQDDNSANDMIKKIKEKTREALYGAARESFKTGR